MDVRRQAGRRLDKYFLSISENTWLPLMKNCIYLMWQEANRIKIYRCDCQRIFDKLQSNFG